MRSFQEFNNIEGARSSRRGLRGIALQLNLMIFQINIFLKFSLTKAKVYAVPEEDYVALQLNLIIFSNSNFISSSNLI